MAEKVWRSLGEATQLHMTSSDAVLIEYCAGAVAELNLPAALLERILDAVTAAIQRAWQYDTERAVNLTVAASVLQVQAEHVAQSWGFFLVEKRLGSTTARRIDVLLYPEGS